MCSWTSRSLRAFASKTNVCGSPIHKREARIARFDPALSGGLRGSRASSRRADRRSTQWQSADHHSLVSRTAGGKASPFGVLAALTFVSVEPKPRPAAALLSNAFDLTPAEAHLAAALANGTSIDEAAGRIEHLQGNRETSAQGSFSKDRDTPAEPTSRLDCGALGGHQHV